MASTPHKLLAALVVLALVAVGCASSTDESTGGEGGGKEAAATAATGEAGSDDGGSEDGDRETGADDSADGGPDTSDGDGETDTAAEFDRAGGDTLDDPYVGTFGNRGYDVDAYDLSLRWDPEAARLDGEAVITADATEALAGFNLELVGLEVTSVTVDGTAAEFDHTDPELAITPSEPIAEGQRFTVTVGYGGTPVESRSRASDAPAGWRTRSDYVYVAGEPVAASTFHPANDHPSDKASFTYRITAPSDLTVAANGTLADKTEGGGETTWTFVQPSPQATYLTTVLIGGFTELDGGTSESGVPIRNVIDDDLVDRLGGVLDPQARMIDAFEERFGPYPFDVYGAAVVEEGFGGALETQTLSIFGSDVLGLDRIAESIVAHELAHQWFGNEVSLDRWEDLWLNEGFASYAEALWREADDPTFTYQQWIRDAMQFGPLLEAPVHRPPIDDLFGAQVYFRGAMTLHALRLEVGDETFFDLLRTWVERYGGGNATTADFEELAEELSGRDLDALFEAWLRTDELPAELDGVQLSTP